MTKSLKVLKTFRDFYKKDERGSPVRHKELNCIGIGNELATLISLGGRLVLKLAQPAQCVSPFPMA